MRPDQYTAKGKMLRPLLLNYTRNTSQWLVRWSHKYAASLRWIPALYPHHITSPRNAEFVAPFQAGAAWRSRMDPTKARRRAPDSSGASAQATSFSCCPFESLTLICLIRCQVVQTHMGALLTVAREAGLAKTTTKNAITHEWSIT